MTLSNGTRLPKIAWGFTFAVAFAAFGATAVAQVQPAAGGAVTDDPNRIYATVDGEPVTEADLAVVAMEYAQQLGRTPSDMRIPELLEVVIDTRLLAKAAEAAGIDEQDMVKRRLAFERARTLRNEFLRDTANNAVSDESVRARFDKEMADFVPGDELHLRHILVETEEEGKSIIADLAAGGDFAAIAAEKSKDPGSGPNGGDLDFVPRGLTVPEFEDAAFALEVGTYTEAPVQSQFGWHVIRLEEKRKASPPEFAAEEKRIRSEMIREFVTSKVDSLRAAAEIKIIPPPEAPAAEAPAADGAGAGAAAQ